MHASAMHDNVIALMVHLCCEATGNARRTSLLKRRAVLPPETL
jgi:hypothetical protein